MPEQQLQSGAEKMCGNEAMSILCHPCTSKRDLRWVHFSGGLSQEHVSAVMCSHRQLVGEHLPAVNR